MHCSGHKKTCLCVLGLQGMVESAIDTSQKSQSTLGRKSSAHTDLGGGAQEIGFLEHVGPNSSLHRTCPFTERIPSRTPVHCVARLLPLQITQKLLRNTGQNTVVLHVVSLHRKPSLVLDRALRPNEEESKGLALCL